MRILAGVIAAALLAGPWRIAASSRSKLNIAPPTVKVQGYP